MKRWHVFALLITAVLVLGYFYYRGAFRAGGAHTSPTSDYSSASLGGPVHIHWQMVNRPVDGFRLDMPADPRELDVPAYNETGGTEPVKMLFASPDGDTTFAVTWLDNPPVARVNHNIPDRTLDEARDGMLARTQTALINESRVSVNGFPARDISARNGEGGYLNARLIFAANRLYTLMALYPSEAARREQDVLGFYSSFSLEGGDASARAQGSTQGVN